MRSGALGDQQNGGGSGNLGTDVCGAALALGCAGAVSLTCRSQCELAAGFMRVKGRKERGKGLEAGDQHRRRSSCPWMRWHCLPHLQVPAWACGGIHAREKTEGTGKGAGTRGPTSAAQPLPMEALVLSPSPADPDVSLRRGPDVSLLRGPCARKDCRNGERAGTWCRLHSDGSCPWRRWRCLPHLPWLLFVLAIGRNRSNTVIKYE